MPDWIFAAVGRGVREGLNLGRIFVGGRSCRLAQICLLLGLAYWIGPVDVIPARTPYVGHLDELCAVVGSLVVARFLAPDTIAGGGAGTLWMRPAQARTHRLPTFFIVGAARCGTTSLFDALGQHPDVFCSPVKEPNFFCTDRNATPWVIANARRRRVLLAEGEPAPLRLPRVATTLDVESYAGLFVDRAGQKAIGEASTAYLLSTEAAHRIADIIPCARIVIVLRNPVHRAQSEYLMHQQLGRSRRDLDAALAGGALPEGELQSLRNIVEGSLYAPQIARYLAAFPHENILFLIFEEMLRDPETALCQVFDHIGVPRAAGAGVVMPRENESRAVRSAGLNAALSRSGLRDTVLHVLPRGFRRALARRYYKVESVTRPDIPSSLFEDDIGRTEALIGRNLSIWRQ